MCEAKRKILVTIPVTDAQREELAAAGGEDCILTFLPADFLTEEIQIGIDGSCRRITVPGNNVMLGKEDFPLRTVIENTGVKVKHFINQGAIEHFMDVTLADIAQDHYVFSVNPEDLSVDEPVGGALQEMQDAQGRGYEIGNLTFAFFNFRIAGKII